MLLFRLETLTFYIEHLLQALSEYHIQMPTSNPTTLFVSSNPAIKLMRSISDIPLDQVGNIILWTVVECGVGIVAGSLPSLRAFFKSLAKDRSTDDQSCSNGTDLVTIGRVRERSNREVNMELGPDGTVINDRICQEGDTDSTRRMIKVAREDTVEQDGSDEERSYDDSYRQRSR